jgi:putative component of toxin-antitoxin plasmid stabilization module
MTTPKRVIVYATPEGKEPFTDWLNQLRDVVARKRILVRVSRLQGVNYGDCKLIGEGVSELRMFSVLAIESILANAGTIWWFYFAEEIKIAKARILKKQKNIGRNI